MRVPGTQVSAHDVAREFRDRQPLVGRTKLQKLLYFAQGFMLGWTGEPMFYETLEAWPLGPVVAELWKAERRGDPPPPPVALTSRHSSVIDAVMKRYGGLTGQELVRLTHADGPWKIVTEGYNEDGDEDFEPRSVPMAVEVLRSWFANDPEISWHQEEAKRLGVRRDEILAGQNVTPGSLAESISQTLKGRRLIEERPNHGDTGSTRW